jgi:hypothetical protein
MAHQGGAAMNSVEWIFVTMMAAGFIGLIAGIMLV